jgi:LuxR family transcriptional regulator, quorum-sensing system regulator BjaR1
MLDSEAFDFMERCQQHANNAALLDDLLRTVGKLGFEHLLFSGVPVNGQEIAPLVELNGWPTAWFERYSEASHHLTDGVCLFAARTTMPFAWDEVPPPLREAAASRKVAGEAAEFDIRDGFVVPTHSYEHWQSAVSFASSAKLDLSKRDRAQLVSMATFAGLCLQSLATEGDPLHDPDLLSPREREVLRWTAMGKSAGVIAEILGLSEDTVRNYSRRCREKIGVSTTRQAALEAQRRRMLFL